MEILRVILEWIGAIVIGSGVLVSMVYAAFKYLATKWLDSQFAARLQELKHQHDREIEELRFKIAALLDRTTKLHEREFETLPEAWEKLIEAFGYATSTVAGLK